MKLVNDVQYVMRKFARSRAALRISSALVAGLLLARAADAQDAAKTNEALNTLQANLSVCIAYFSIFKECSAGDEKDLLLAEAAIQGLEKKSRAAADAIGLSSDDVALRLDLNLTSQRQLIGSCSGVSILLSRYTQQCNDFVLGVERNSKKRK
jgi:hypothetical protein